MKYTLQQYGDDFEKQFWPGLHESFPNYEILWQRFVVPLRMTPENIELRPGIDSLLEKMCMAHYTIYYHFGRAHELQVKTGLDYYEGVFFYLSAATEMVEQFLFSLAKVYEKTHEKKLILKLKKQEYCEQVETYWKKHYKEHLDRFRNRGQSINVPLLNINKITKMLFNEQFAENTYVLKAYKHWRGITDNHIRHYRNLFTHNPRIGRVEATSGPMVPTSKYLGSLGSNVNPTWSELVHNPNPANFIALDTLIGKSQTQIVQATNELWVHVIKLLEIISTSAQYKRMANGETEQTLGVLVPDENNRFQPSSASGTSHIPPYLQDTE